MDQPITIAVASFYKPLVALIEQALQGVKAIVVQVAPNEASVLKALRGSPNQLVVLHERKDHSDWLDLAIALDNANSRPPMVVFAESSDVGAVAKGIVSGVANFVPLAKGTSPQEIKTIINDAIAGKEPSADCLYGRVKAMLPQAPPEGDKYFCPSGRSFSVQEAMEHCLGLGLTSDQTADVLGVDRSTVHGVEATTRRLHRGVNGAPSARLKALGTALLAGLALVAATRWRSDKRFVPVSGKVTIDGQPVRDATIFFARDGASHIASGKLGGDGQYKLATLREGDGAEEGSYVVWLDQRPAIREHVDMNDPQYTEKMVKLIEKTRAERESKSKGNPGEIPAAYRDRQSSPLRVEVRGNAPVRLDFELKR